jgi:hypothetical protein
MPEINVTLLTYFVVIIFAISGFYRGWWKEAITTIVLAFLIFLLQIPDFARNLITTFNTIVITIWEIVPESFKDLLRSTFGIDTSASALQADANSTSTWLTLLILLILGAILINRLFLPGGIRRQGYAYNVTPIGAILGAILGGFNGFILANLILEYLTGRALPGGSPATEIALNDGRAVAIASPGINFPDFTILDSYIPWVIIGLGFLLLVAVLRTRVGIHSRNGFRRIDYRVPYGYEMIRYRRE